MQWVITYRSKSGEQEQLSLEAESREAVFAELKKRGISAVRIEQSNGKAKPCKASPSVKVSPLIKGVIAGIVVVLGALTALYCLRPGLEEPRPTSVERQPKPKTDSQATSVKHKVEKPLEEQQEIPYWKRDTTNGLSEVQLRKWQQVRRPRTEPVNIERKTPKYKIFEHRSENEIACLLTLEPGKGLIGSPNYRGMKEDFLKSCEKPIIIEADDDEYTKNLKQMMISAKIELRNRMNDGEDFDQIMRDSRTEMQKLATYRNQLKAELFRMFREGTADADAGDMLEAANKLLESKGIAPLKMGPLLRVQLDSMKNLHEVRGE